MNSEQQLRRLLQAATADQPAHVDLLKTVREQARPTRRRVLLPALASLGAAVTAAIAVVVVVVLFTGAPPAHARVVAAAEHTAGQSFRVHVVQDTTHVYDGAVDPARSIGWFTGPGGGEWRYVGDTAYAKRPTDSLPAGKQWVAQHRPTAVEWAQLPAQTLLIKLAPSDPQAALARLRSAISVKESGHAAGPDWTGRHYTFTLDSATSAAHKPAHSSVTGTVDVDTAGQVRRMTFTMHTPAADSATGTENRTRDLNQVMEFSDFGTPVTVTAPPADQVVQDPDLAPKKPPAVKTPPT